MQNRYCNKTEQKCYKELSKPRTISYSKRKHNFCTSILKHLTSFMILYMISKYFFKFATGSAKVYFTPQLSEFQNFNLSSKILAFYDLGFTSLTADNSDNFFHDEKIIHSLMKKYGVHGLIFKLVCREGKFLPLFHWKHLKHLPFCLSIANENCGQMPNNGSKDIDDAYNIFYSNVHKLYALYFSQNNYITKSGKPLLIVIRRNSFYSSSSKSACQSICNLRHDLFSLICVDFSMKYFFMQAVQFPPIVLRDYKSLKCSQNMGTSSASIYTPVVKQPFAKKIEKWSVPFIYQHQLREALSHTHQVLNKKQDVFLLVDSWKLLQPSNLYGFAFLEATRMAQLSYHLVTSSKLINVPSIGIFIHAFYMDVMPEIMHYLKMLTQSCNYTTEIYIAVLPKYAKIVTSYFVGLNLTVNIFQFGNRGRDILPFIATLPKILGRHNIIVKVNTKKSMLKNKPLGNIWRKHSYKCLLHPSNLMKAIFALRHNSSLGIIYPAGLALPLRYYMYKTTEIFSKISLRMGASPSSAIENLFFGAGTMFIARSNALLLLANVAFNESSFEQESGQLDKTLAHAIERVIAVSVYKSGYGYLEMNEPNCTSENFNFFPKNPAH